MNNMYLDERQKKIVVDALKDYNFIKEEIENRIRQDYNLEELSKFLVRFKDIEISNIEEYDDIGYLDFIYKDVNTCVIWEYQKGLRVSNTLEIYDKEQMEYIIEDFCTIEEYEKMLNRTREENLNDLVATLKYYESRGLEADYKAYSKKVISFLKENW